MEEREQPVCVRVGEHVTWHRGDRRSSVFLVVRGGWGVAQGEAGA